MAQSVEKKICLDCLLKLFIDINECEDGSHTCHGTAKCVNTEGSFHCECLNGDSCSFSELQTIFHL